MRILFIAMSNSIHTARWINQLRDQNWDIHLFPSIDVGVAHPDLRDITVHYPVYAKQSGLDGSVRCRGFPVFSKRGVYVGRYIMRKFLPDYYTVQLKRTIEKLKPDIVHSMEIQHAGYLTLEAKKMFKRQFPPWIVSNWGSDIYLFGRLSEHEPKIRDVLSECNYYFCEDRRDVLLAHSFGFKGEVLGIIPATGGLNLEEISKLRQPGPVSERRIIMLKGHQGIFGRALTGLRALERCAGLLKDYQIVIYSGGAEDVKIAAELFTKSTGIPTRIISHQVPHKEMLKLHGQARISIGLSISDGLSPSLLEAMAMGSFPIQSNTGCTDEWIEDGKTGILVHPNDPEDVEMACRRALTDDALVNQASYRNAQLVVERLDQSIIKPQVVKMYQKVYKNNTALPSLL